jgi:hypothetical protein
LNVRQLNGPIKLVFVNDGAYAPEQFKSVVESVVGFAENARTNPNLAQGKSLFEIEPFKSMKDKFSVYYVENANLPQTEGRSPSEAFVKVFTRKLCPKAHYTIVVSDKNFGSFANVKYNSFSIMDGRSYVTKKEMEDYKSVVAHELAHAAFRLDDEYYVETKRVSRSKSIWSHKRSKYLLPNCVLDAKNAKFKGWSFNLTTDAILNNWKGCGGACPIGCSNWLKPSEQSIMSKAKFYTSFNKFSENFIRKRIDYLARRYGGRR